MMQNLEFGVYLLISDFLTESFKANKNWQKRHPFYNTFSFKKPHLVSTHSTIWKIYSRNTAENPLIDVRKNICTAPFLDVQELHSQSTWKPNVCISLYISVQKYLFQRRRKILSGGKLINLLKAPRCLSLAKWF